MSRSRKPPAAARCPTAGSWLRARRPEQKRERREAILTAAVGLLDAEGVEGATLSAIGRSAGLSKANCYRYFESREAILLAVALAELAGFTREVEAALEPLRGSCDLDATAEVFVRAAVERPRLCMLASALASVIERNVGPDTIAAFKRGSLDLLLRAMTALRRALPALSDEAARAFVTLFPLVVAGVWPAANPAPVVAGVLARPELAPMRIDLEEVMRTHTRALLRGLVTPGP